MLKYRSPILIILITAFALMIRLWGIDWGLPNELHAVSYHPDETVMLLHSTSIAGRGGLNIFAGQFLPHFYNYGSLQLMLINVTAGIVSTYTPPSHASTVGSTVFPVYLIGRVLTAVMGTITVAALWAFGRRIYGDTAGLIGSLFLAITPLHAQHSHFMTVDVPATMWVTLALLWSVKAVQDDSPIQALLTAGALAGFAAATKYNCAIVILPVIASAFLRHHEDDPVTLTSKAGRAIAAVAVMGAAFLIGCPGSLLEHAQFVKDFEFESRHVMTEQELWFQGTGIGWWYIVERNLDAGLSLPLLVGAAAGTGYALYRRTPGDWLMLAFALPYYLVVGAAVSRYARYEIPLLPVLVLLAARLIGDGFGSRSRMIKISAYSAITILTFVAATSTYLLERPFSEPDPRDRAETWIISNVGHAETIGVPTEPWFYTPPICRFFALPGYGQWEDTPGASYELSRMVFSRNAPFDSDLLGKYLPSVVVMSEYEYYDRLRMHDPAALDYLQLLSRDYQKPLVFADVHPLGGLKTIGGLRCQDLPTDMLYPSPTILIYVRRPSH